MKTAGQKIVTKATESLPFLADVGKRHFQGRLEADITEIFSVVKNEIDAVEAEIMAQVNLFEPGVQSYLRFALETHGKRLRPALVFFAGGIVGKSTHEHTRLGLIVELIHLATLVHDDIIDEAQLRRGQPTVQRKWGAATAVLIGDSIFAHALMTASLFDDTRISREVARAANEVCQGEILQTQRRFDFSMTIPEYTRLIEMKTGALFRVSTALGAYVAGGNADQVAAMSRFGDCLGIAYQIWDDCVDLFGSENQIGKSLGTDLDKGKLTLPLLLLLAKSSEAEQEQVRSLMLGESPASQRELAGAVRIKGCLHESIDLINACLAEAQSVLRQFPANPHRDHLEGLLSYLDIQSQKLRKC